MVQVTLLTQAAYARHRQCSKAAVSKAVAENRISLIDGKIDPAVADVQWAKNTRARVGAGRPPSSPMAQPGQLAGAATANAGDPIPPGGDDYWKSRARREAAEADLAEMNLAAKRSELIQVRAVELVWSAAMVAVRDHLLQVSARLAPLIASETNIERVHNLLELEHHKALSLLANASNNLPGDQSS